MGGGLFASLLRATYLAFALLRGLCHSMARRRSLVLVLFSLMASTLPASPYAGLASGEGSSGTGFVINEVLYDPEGTDDGLEFVELYNPTEDTLSLRGLALETGNGAKAGDWRLGIEWQSDHFVEPHGFVLIGEAMVTPAPHFVAELDLQNGPDACRLRNGADVIDLVGWGLHTFPEYYEGAPSEDVTSGASLARLPDGIDSENNSADLAPLVPPTPGRRNFCLQDAGFVRGTMATVPALPLPFEHAQITVELQNLGARELSSGECVVDFFETDRLGQAAAARGVIETGRQETATFERKLLGSCALVSLAPGQSETLTLSWRPGVEACVTLEAILRLSGDENPGNDSTLLRTRVGGGDLALNEIMYAPAPGGTEWVELINRGRAAIDLKGWRIEDSSGKKSLITSFSFVVLPGEYVLLVQNEELFRAASRACTGRLIEPDGGWPSLNNYTQTRTDYADIVCVSDPTGCISDHVAYSEDWCTRTYSSLERVSTSIGSRDAANWSSSVAEEGSTPCAPNSISESATPGRGREIGMSSRVLSPNGDGLDDRIVFSFALPSQGFRANFSIFDCEGRLVKRLLDQRKVGTVVQAIWDGTDEESRPVAPALYIVNLCLRGPAGEWEDARSTVAVAPRPGK